uniref:Uncharacterized protein n=1 Tax=Arundo donax TaxID=35708 RepID=A0A0A9FS62_ARUDO
MLAAIVSKTE